MRDNKRILVCGDERDLREMVGEYLTKKGYEVSLASGGAELREILSQDDPFSLLLLDITMPGDDGLTILRQLRASSNLPVVLLTAANEQVDKIVGLEMGADDYVTKPFDLRELEARVKAVIRRTGQRLEKSPEEPSKVAVGPHVLDTASGALHLAGGEVVDITAMEYQLLKTFSDNRGKVLNRDQLAEFAHNREWDPFDRSIDIRISRLRRKIEQDPSKPRIIKTIRGKGYLLD